MNFFRRQPLVAPAPLSIMDKFLAKMDGWDASLKERIAIEKTEQLCQAASKMVCKARLLQPAQEGTPTAPNVESSSNQGTFGFGILALAYYLASNFADSALIERLLWPERFYNNTDPITLLKLAAFTPLGGPTLGVALKAIDSFNKNGTGFCTNLLAPPTGTLLGTPMFPEEHGGTKYYCRSGNWNELDIPEDVRNTFWLTVLSLVKYPTSLPDNKLTPDRPLRATLPVHHLHLHGVAKDFDSDSILISERKIIDFIIVPIDVAILASEALALIFAAITVCLHGLSAGGTLAFWMTAPFFIKLGSVVASPARESIVTSDSDETSAKLFEVDDLKLGFMLIQGQDAIVRQFFHLYGHPKGDTSLTLEQRVLIIALPLVHMFCTSYVFLRLELMPIWACFQLTLAISWLLARCFNMHTVGRTEERVAQAFDQGKKVIILSEDGKTGVEAILKTKYVNSVTDGRWMVRDIIQDFTNEGFAPNNAVAENESDFHLDGCAREEFEPSTPEHTSFSRFTSASGAVIDGSWGSGPYATSPKFEPYHEEESDWDIVKVETESLAELES